MNEEEEAIEKESLETAYIEIEDNQETAGQETVMTDVKSILLGSSGQKSKKSAQSKTIRVQFNPTQMEFNAGAKKHKWREKAGIDKREDGRVEHADVSLKENEVMVSFQLIFDRSIYADASVQAEVESFLAMIKSPYVRKISFYWGKLYFKGVLESVDADYVMFDMLGIPVRAKVKLNINLMQMQV